MNNIYFCESIYNSILNKYQSFSGYRITKYAYNPFKALIEYLPIELNDIAKNVRLKKPILKLILELCTKETGERFLALNVYTKINTIYFDMYDCNWHLKANFKPKTILIFSEKDIYSMNDTKNCYYPSTFKDLKTFPNELVSIIVSCFTKTHIWKDFISNKFYPPVKINELSLYYNKKDYLEKTFNLNLSKSINKLPLNQSYAICCALKYIKSEQQPFIFNIKINFNIEYNIDKRKRKYIAANYLKLLLSTKNNNTDKTIINDYVDFSLQQGLPIDILAGKRKITTLHNEIVAEIILKSTRYSKIIIPETPLKYLKLPKEFVLLNTNKALINEGIINHNCVGGYSKKISSGKCVIYSANIKDEHLTIEIKLKKTKSGYKFYVNQCLKAYNNPCSPNILAYVKECLDKCSINAINKYKKQADNATKSNKL